MKIQHALAAIVFAILLSFAGGMEFTSQRFERSQAGMMASEEAERASTAVSILKINKITEGWMARAQSCESKFDVGTIIYEPRPVASLPLMNGMVSLTLNGGAMNIPSPAVPAWYIPAQVDVYTHIPGAMYAWQDKRTMQIKGTFTAKQP